MLFPLQILIALLALTACLALLVRTAPMRPDRWHADPETAPRPARPNAWLMRDREGDAPALHIAAAPAELAARLGAVMQARPRTSRLAGSPEAGFVTYIERSALWGFPDAISIRLTQTATGTRVSLFSRSRFGHSDLGVNRARARAIAAALTP